MVGSSFSHRQASSALGPFGELLVGGEQLEGQGLVKDAGVVGLVGGVGGLALIEGIRVGLDQLGAAVFYDAPRHLHGQGVGVLPLVQDGHGLSKGEVASVGST